MALQLGDVAPDFEADTTEGRIKFHDYIGNSWVVFFSHPKDFTPVCTTELGYMAKIKHEFEDGGSFFKDILHRAHKTVDELQRKVEEKVRIPLVGGGAPSRIPQIKTELRLLRKKMATLERKLKDYQKSA